MSRRIPTAIASLLAVLAAVAVLGSECGRTLASLSDSEASTGNRFAAGTLDLKVNDADTPDVLFSCGPLQPGDDRNAGSQTVSLRNAGSLDGLLSVSINDVEGQASSALLMSMIYDSDDLSPEEPLSAWEGATFGPRDLPAGQSRDLVISWQLDPDAGRDAMGQSAGFKVTFDLRQP